jgi:hypothetical protein
MFDLRYHVASLAAVFLALVVGILIGVGLTTQGVISTSERKVLNQRISDLQHQRDSARQRASDLNRAKRVADAYVKRTYRRSWQGGWRRRGWRCSSQARPTGACAPRSRRP